MNMDPSPTFQINEHVEELYWKVILSNDQTVYHDDLRPPSWLRLKDYCEEKQLYIKHFQLVFRSHIEDIDPADEYYFAKAHAGFLFTGYQKSGWIIGRKVTNNLVACTWWEVPELTKSHSFTKPYEKYAKTMIPGCAYVTN